MPNRAQRRRNQQRGAGEALLAEKVESKSEWLGINPHFVSEVLASGGVVFIGYAHKSRERFGWDVGAIGGKILDKSKALAGLHGDSVVNTWSNSVHGLPLASQDGIQILSAKLVPPDEAEANGVYAVVDANSSVTAVDIQTEQTADELRQRFETDPYATEDAIINSPWLTVSRLGLQTMAEIAPVDGYLRPSSAQLDELFFA